MRGSGLFSRLIYGLMFVITAIFVVQIYAAYEGASGVPLKILFASGIALTGCSFSLLMDRGGAAGRATDRRLLAGTAVMVVVLYGMIGVALLTPLGGYLQPWEFLIFPICTFTFFLRSQVSFLLLAALEGVFIFYAIGESGSHAENVIVLSAYLLGFLLLLALLFFRDRDPGFPPAGPIDCEVPIRVGPIAGLLMVDLFGLFLVVKPPAPEGFIKDVAAESRPTGLVSVLPETGGPPRVGFDRDLKFGDNPEDEAESAQVFVAQVRDPNGRVLEELPFPPLWKVASLPHYRNGRWEGPDDEPALVRSEAGRVVVSSGPWHPGSVTVDQWIILSPLRGDALFAFYPAESIEMPAVRVDSEGMLRRPVPSYRPVRYRVRSHPVALEPGALHWTRVSSPDPRYLSIPEEVRRHPAFLKTVRRIREPVSAASIISAAMQMFSEFQYMREPSLETAGDPTIEFLEKKRGYCQHFASALTLLLRSRGLPARVAIGFAGGDWNDFAKIVVVKRRHAHAWTEVHFQGLGWVPFDPAGVASGGPTARAEGIKAPETREMLPTEDGPETPKPEESRPEGGEPGKTELVEEKKPEPVEEFRGRTARGLFEELWNRIPEEPATIEVPAAPAEASEPLPVPPRRRAPKTESEFFGRVAVSDTLLVLAVLVVAVGSGMMLLRARKRRIEHRREEIRKVTGVFSKVEGPGTAVVELSPGTPGGRVVRSYVDFLERAADCGYPKAAHETPSEYRAGVEARASDVEGLTRLTEIFDRIRYGPEPPTSEEVTAAREASREAARSLRRRRRESQDLSG